MASQILLVGNLTPFDAYSMPQTDDLIDRLGKANHLHFGSGQI